MLLFTGCSGDLNLAVMRGGGGVSIVNVCVREETVANVHASVSDF